MSHKEIMENKKLKMDQEGDRTSGKEKQPLYTQDEGHGVAKNDDIKPAEDFGSLEIFPEEVIKLLKSTFATTLFIFNVSLIGKGNKQSVEINFFEYGR